MREDGSIFMIYNRQSRFLINNERDSIRKHTISLGRVKLEAIDEMKYSNQTKIEPLRASRKCANTISYSFTLAFVLRVFLAAAYLFLAHVGQSQRKWAVVMRQKRRIVWKMTRLM